MDDDPAAPHPDRRRVRPESSAATTFTRENRRACPASKDSFAAKDTLTVAGTELRDLQDRRRRRPGERRPTAVLAEGAAGEPDPHRGRREHHRRPHPRAGQLGSQRRAQRGDPVHPGPGDHAGLHRGALRRRPGHHARGDGRPRRRPGPDQPARAGRDGDRPLGDRRRLRPRRRLRAQRRAGVRAQPRAVPVPALGPDRVRRVQGRPAGHRHRASGQHRAPGAGGHVPGGTVLQAYPDSCVGTDSHTTMVNGLGRARLGRRRHRGRGRDARAAGVDAHPPGRRVQAHRRDPGRHHRDRRRADDHRDAAQARRRRQVRGVLRRRRRRRSRWPTGRRSAT